MTSPARRVARWIAFFLLATSLVLAQLAIAEGPIPRHFRVNAGGSAVEGSPGWAADTSSDPSTYLADDSNATASTTRPIEMSDPSVPPGTPQSVFQTRRWDPQRGGDMRWAFPVDPGRWQVNLYFAETNPNAWSVGERLFDVSIEGRAVLTRFDIYALVGANRGLVTDFTVEADNVLEIAFDDIQRRPIVSGIELIALDVEAEVESAPASPTPEPSSEPTPTVPPPLPKPDPSDPASVSEPPPSDPATSSAGRCDGVVVPSGSDIQSAVNGAPEGATLCLTGSYALATPVKPKAGQSFVGPATIVAANANDTGFSVRVPNVSFVDLDMSGFALRGIDCSIGTRIIGGRYHHNGRNGFGCGLDGLGGVLVDGVEVDHNGSEAELGGGASGMKFARGHGVVVRDSFIHDNLGNGVWCDVQCGDYTVVDNVIVHNSRKGVHYEKSGASDEFVTYEGSAYIARNVIQDNGWEGREHAADGGIGLVSSKNVLIEANVFGGNHRASVIVRQDGRLEGDKHGWVISNVTIRDNTLNGNELIGCDIEGVTCG